MTLEQWNTVIGVNLTGQFLCARAATREFKRRGVVPSVSRAAGKLICMSSVHQQIPWAGHANYAASKGGVDMLMRSIAQELAPHFIRVNSIAPGAIRTPINTVSLEYAGGLCGSHDFGAVQTDRGAGRYRSGGGVAGVGGVGLRDRRDVVRGWWNDFVSGVRDGRMIRRKATPARPSG